MTSPIISQWETEQMFPVPRVRIKSLPFLQYYSFICNHWLIDWCSGYRCSFEVPLKGHLRSSQIIRVHIFFYTITRYKLKIDETGINVLVSSRRLDWYATRHTWVITWPWPLVNFSTCPFKVTMCVFRTALTRGTRYRQNYFPTLSTQEVIWKIPYS